jgi:hypothetical protein
MRRELPLNSPPNAWCEKCRAGRQAPEEAARFARENWTAFLSVAHEGWGKLLIRIAIQRAGQRRKQVGCRARSVE